MTKEQYIIQACVTANPSIKDLVFGCQVNQKYAAKRPTLVVSDVHESQGGDKFVYTTHGATIDQVFLERYKPSDNYIQEIIGREITPLDVLKALPVGWMLKSSGNNYEFVYMVDYGGKKFENKYFIWYPGSLTDQSERIKSHIAALLGYSE